MNLTTLFTAEELASIDAGTYDLTKEVLAAKLDLCAAYEREACAKVCYEYHYDIGGSCKDAAAAIRSRSSEHCARGDA